MYLFNVRGKEYRVRFTYRAICRGDVLDEFTNSTKFDEADGARGVINQLVTATARALIAGLQKYHSDEFGYKDETEHEAVVEKVLDMFDDYEDESTEDHPQSAYTLFKDLQDELEKNGFLSAMSQMASEAEEMSQTAEEIKTEIEKEPARVVAMKATAHTESES